METNQSVQNAVDTSIAENQKPTFLSSVKSLFEDLKNKLWWWEKKQWTKTFTLTRRDALVSVSFAIIVVAWAVVYGTIVMGNYSKINENTEPLKTLSTYNVPLSDQIQNNWIKVDNKVLDLIDMNNEVHNKLQEREDFKIRQKNHYEVLLQNIYLPSLNVWKDPYTKNFDITVMGQKYLEKDKFQDLYLIQYRSDFIKYVWNDADYNIVDNISIWDMVELEWSDYFYVPITVSFTSPNKRSFLLLVNKLSMTSNTTNIALLNEFFFRLLIEIKQSKVDAIKSLMQQYWSEFSSSTNRTWPKNLDDLEGDVLVDYQNKVIWYYLYNRINNDVNEENILIDDALIVKTIRDSVDCEQTKSDWECFYSFRERYRDLPYLAYKIWMDTNSQTSKERTKWLHDFLQDLPSVIAITDFWFNKYSNASFLNNEEEQYEWTLSFRAYGRSISSEELDEASISLWKLCFWEQKDKQIVISPDQALASVDERISSLWWSDEDDANNSSSIVSLLELQWLFTKIQSEYSWLTNYNKMIKLFEIWRMMNDANLCNT